MKKIAIVTALIFAFAFTVSPAFAAFDGTVVWNHNSAAVMNDVEATANTGSNYADGSYGGSGGDGGSIRNGRWYHGPVQVSLLDEENGGEEGDGDVDDSATGNGGAGGNAAAGGAIMTGDADATAMLDSTVNSNLTEIEACPCDTDVIVEEEEEQEEMAENYSFRSIFIANKNEAFAGNRVRAAADTGVNDAEGSYGGEGGEGGDIKNSGEGDVDDSTTGSGSTGGTGGEGGLVQTGLSTSHAHGLSVINSNVTRITRAQAIQE